MSGPLPGTERTILSTQTVSSGAGSGNGPMRRRMHPTKGETDIQKAKLTAQVHTAS